MRALVTGAAGFIGLHVVDALVDCGAEVLAFDRALQSTGPSPFPDAVELFAGDVLDADAVRQAVAGADAVFHLAGVYSYARDDGALMQAVNVEGTRIVLEAAARGRRRRIVHTSTCATCGPIRGRAADERDLPPRSQMSIAYKRTKMQGEQLAIRAARDGLDVVIVNPTVPVGPGDLRPTPTGKMVADVAHGRARAYLAHSALNVVAVQDVATGHLRAFELGRSGERYLLGGENLTVREVFTQIAAAAGRRAPRIGIPWTAAHVGAQLLDGTLRPVSREARMLVPDEVRAGRLPHLFDDDKARSQLGYRSRPAAEALIAATAGAINR